MFNLGGKLFLAALAIGFAGPVFAADLPEEPQVVEQAPATPDVGYGGWYIRGDLGYRKSDFRGADYVTYGAEDCGPCGSPVAVPGSNSFSSGDLKGGFSVGGGIGYKVSKYFRTDLTLDYWAKTKFTGSTTDGIETSTDTSKMGALLMLANAYADLGTWHGITPYVGAGIGGAYLKWDDLHNQFPGVDDRHSGGKGWRFAYALMAGASYCLTDKMMLDAGYRFSHIQGGKMFDYADSSAGGPGAGPGYDHGFNNHEVRAGLRYQFGGSTGCEEPVAYEPEPAPVYTK
jgi:opacity protein-like surface antigen